MTLQTRKRPASAPPRSPARTKTAKPEDAGAKDERLKPHTHTGKGVTNDRYSKSESAAPQVSPPAPQEKA
jgi:hypothetical protein